jgi:hypothetical protein
VSTAPVRTPVAAPAPSGSDGYLLVHIDDLSDQELLHNIKELLQSNTGAAEAYMLIGSGTPKKIRLPFRVAVSDELLEKLNALVGAGRATHAK